MTEQEWLASTDPTSMIASLRSTWKQSFFEFGKWLGVRGQNGTERKLRLFACACMRHVWERLDGPQRRATDLAERYADGKAKRKEVDAAGERLGIPAAREVTLRLAGDAARSSADEAARILATNNVADPRRRFVLRQLAGKFRDVFGNPFRPVVFDPKWRTEHTVGIAGKMYDEREFAAMPILADALEEAGCDSQDILTHCREPGVHVRGCWIVDLVLGKD